MKFYLELLKLLFRKFILRKNNGEVIEKFAEKMGIVYIKLAQILAMQNYDNLFTEKDRKLLSNVCDDINPIDYKDIKHILEKEYHDDLDSIFMSIDPRPIGSASVSQVHRAILKTGEEVAIKVKRKDVEKSIDKDIEKIKKLMHRYGKLFKFNNYVAGDAGLDLYLSWIKEETDFNHEKENIKKYQQFADQVNGKVINTKQIIIPKVYEELCTDNVIVMKYISNKTFNQLEQNEENNTKIVEAINSYLKSSFYALFNNEEVSFHGDPHGGNVFIDDNGNIGFLDMGLLFTLNKQDIELIKDLFFGIYSGNSDKVYKLLLPYGNMNEEQKLSFKEDIIKYCADVRTKEVSNYYTDMMKICLKYEFLPPRFLMCMVKAFICLNGISIVHNNLVSVQELLKEQIMEYLVKQSINDSKETITDTIKVGPSLFKNILNHGLVKGAIKQMDDSPELKKSLKKTLSGYKDLVNIVKLYGQDNNDDTYVDGNQKVYK